VLIYILELRLDYHKLDLVFSFVLRREIMTVAWRKAFELPRHLLGRVNLAVVVHGSEVCREANSLGWTGLSELSRSLFFFPLR
jgi:hypothetical protein